MFFLLAAAGIGAMVHNAFWTQDRLREQQARIEAQHERIRDLEQQKAAAEKK